jgi:hypothetical protein
VLALAVVPAISIAVQKFGRYLRELSHSTQAAAAMAASIAEVCEQNINFILEFIYFELLNSWYHAFSTLLTFLLLKSLYLEKSKCQKEILKGSIRG